MTAGVLNALLGQSKVDGWVYPVLGLAAIASALALGFALRWSLKVQKVYETEALNPDTIDQYVAYAERGNVAVAKRLIETYTKLLRGRRQKNALRGQDLKCATRLCGISAGASLVQLIAVFVALITK